MRVLVCGGRRFGRPKPQGPGASVPDQSWRWERQLLKDVLDGIVDDTHGGKVRPEVIIHGGAPGADWLAGLWADINDIPVEEYQADWDVYGNAAGPIRNKRMLDEGKPDLVIAFPGGKGTANMVKLAREAGVKVIEVPDG